MKREANENANESEKGKWRWKWNKVSEKKAREKRKGKEKKEGRKKRKKREKRGKMKKGSSLRCWSPIACVSLPLLFPSVPTMSAGPTSTLAGRPTLEVYDTWKRNRKKEEKSEGRVKEGKEVCFSRTDVCVSFVFISFCVPCYMWSQPILMHKRLDIIPSYENIVRSLFIHFHNKIGAMPGEIKFFRCATLHCRNIYVHPLHSVV